MLEELKVGVGVNALKSNAKTALSIAMEVTLQAQIARLGGELGILSTSTYVRKIIHRCLWLGLLYTVLLWFVEAVTLL